MSAPGFASAPQAGVSSSYGTATPTKLQYSELVSISLAANQINLVDAAAYGHRIQTTIPYPSLNTIFSWSRAAGALAPSVSVDYSALTTALAAAVVGSGFNDVDSNANGLSFSSASLSDSADPRYRATAGTYTWNDIVLAYVLYKLYGKTNYPTKDNVFNMEDASGMVSNSDVYQGITTSMGNNQDKVAKLFRDLISSDPQRFFDSAGKQVPGIFEKNGDVDGSGSWNFVQGDVIEIRIEFTFAAAITRRDITEQQIDSNTEPQATRNIAAGEKFAIRWQILAGPPPYTWTDADMPLLWRNVAYVINSLRTWRNATLGSQPTGLTGQDLSDWAAINRSLSYAKPSDYNTYVYYANYTGTNPTILNGKQSLFTTYKNWVNNTAYTELNEIITRRGLSIPQFVNPCTTNPSFAGQP